MKLVVCVDINTRKIIFLYQILKKKFLFKRDNEYQWSKIKEISKIEYIQPKFGHEIYSVYVNNYQIINSIFTEKAF